MSGADLHYLREAIRRTFEPDPYTRDPEPELVEAVALAVEAMAAVSSARRANLAANPWKSQTAGSHLDHAVTHVDNAHYAEVEGERLDSVDRETGLPHHWHALLRLAFANARMLGIGDKKRECVLCRFRSRSGSECAECRAGEILNFSKCEAEA